jgi:hypothetical protein
MHDELSTVRYEPFPHPSILVSGLTICYGQKEKAEKRQSLFIGGILLSTQA